MILVMLLLLYHHGFSGNGQGNSLGDKSSFPASQKHLAHLLIRSKEERKIHLDGLRYSQPEYQEPELKGG